MTNAKEEKSEKQSSETPPDQVLAVGKTAIETAQEAIARAQEAVEKIQQEGVKILESIVKEGGKIFEETQKAAGGKVEEMKGRVEEARDKAAETFDNLEEIFEDRVSRALSRLGIPTRDDFQAIAKRLDELNVNVQTLIKSRSQTVVPEKDDLKEISGLGPVLEGKLNSQGIISYRQIAQLGPKEIDHIEELLHSSGRIQRENWIAQAKELHFKKYGERL
jgi:poly(hydroxyalkanoate) granule-associated protein